jgi:hypothetical protein
MKSNRKKRKTANLDSITLTSVRIADLHTNGSIVH